MNARSCRLKLFTADRCRTATFQNRLPTLRQTRIIVIALALAALGLASCQPLESPSRAGQPVDFPYTADWQVLGDRSLLFRSNIDGDWEIYLLNGRGRQLIRITDDRSHNRYADASPDGRWVIFSSNIDGGDFDLFQVRIDGTQLSQITANDLEDYSPSYSPDGRRIAFERDVDYFQIFELVLDSGAERQLTDYPHHSYAPEWAATGDRLAFFANRDGDFDLFSISLDGEDIQKIVDTPAFAQFPDYNPVRDLLAFEAIANGEWDVWTTAPNLAPIRLTGPGGDDRDPDFSPDGEQIAFSRQDGESVDIYVMANDGSNARLLLATPGSDYQPVWLKPGTE